MRYLRNEDIKRHISSFAEILITNVVIVLIASFYLSLRETNEDPTNIKIIP
jgi:hypothetical protein